MSWLCMWWRQIAGAGAGCRCRCWCWCCELAVHPPLLTVKGNKPPLAAVKGDHNMTMKCMNLCAQHHTVLSLERSLSISAVGYLHSSGSVLADSRVKGCTLCAHTFVRIMFYAQRQALNRKLFQHATHTIVVLDTAWPWANDTYGFCCLRAYFLCA